MGDDRFIDSRFWDWYVSHRPFTLDEEQTLRQKALSILVDCVNSGEIPSLDGIATPLSWRLLDLRTSTFTICAIRVGRGWCKAASHSRM